VNDARIVDDSEDGYEGELDASILCHSNSLVLAVLVTTDVSSAVARRSSQLAAHYPLLIFHSRSAVAAGH
jgi:hypothetical protein